MEIIPTDILSSYQKIAVLKLWNLEYPEQLQCKTMAEFEHYLFTLANVNHFLLLDDAHEIVGWAFKFTRDTAVWFAIILDGTIHLKGFGSLLLDQLKDKETSLNGWVVDHNHYLRSNAEIYRSPLNFYLKNGFRVIEDVRLELPHLSAVKITWKKTDDC
ncbi:N-acetyltransferase [Pedobacter sp. L105]|uniref:N-acetyltransferase n=1 Tax=Pedobacter sp. L105 TaxID=1641871 RepID=UPI00131BF281|nr:N-acetyltransferase [Pedobacter sp. L105]